MNFAESVSYLYSLGHETLAMKLGIDSIRRLSTAFDEPQKKFPAVHIAGTNGKGSTAAMVASIARAAGLRVGLFTSPHLISITERISINGSEISQDDFARLATYVRKVSELLIAENAIHTPPTFFEQVTMIGFTYFAERDVDLAVLEVGLGGRLDATNICEPAGTAITPVGFDHQQYLGDTLTSIAGEKAGIIKPGIPVVVAPQEDEAMRAIIARCEELKTPITTTSDPIEIEATSSVENIGRYRFCYRTSRGEYEVRLNLRGRHQITNALVAIQIAEHLNDAGFDIPSSAIVEGLGKTEWPGRLEMIHMSPSQAPLLLDGAHNAESVRVLRAFLDEHFSSIPITMIFGAMADKAIAEMAGALFPKARQIILAKIANIRAAEPAAIADKLTEPNRTVAYANNAADALAEALLITPPDGLIVVCGSLFLVGEIKQSLHPFKS
jgi:dihydrofolate synthase/folylpolyglutamate synthase